MWYFWPLKYLLIKRIVEDMKIILIIIAIISAFGLSVFVFMKSHPVFGGIPDDENKKKIDGSANFSKGNFVNLEPTVLMDPNEGSMFSTMVDWIKGPENGKPDVVITSQFDNKKFNATPDSGFNVTWFGHSSVMLNIAGSKVLIDPVFSGYASPIPGTNTSFTFSNPIDMDEIPEVDILLISHDHYDHLDMPTIKSLDSRVKQYLVPLGVKAHLLRWGVSDDKVTEFDWWDELTHNGLQFVSAPARHFSGRGFTRNTTLWCSWVIRSDNHSVFFGGDSGYGKHFAEIGEKYGPFDLTFIECGQYNTRWPHVHTQPEESVQANIDVKGDKMIAIHWSKYQLALHSWTDPIERARAEAKNKGVKLIEPIIGEVLNIN